MKPIRLAIIVSLVVLYGMTLAVYPALPDVVASHWNAAGEADGSTGKLFGLLLIPLITTGFVALMAVLPRIDPLKKNYEEFRNLYEGFILVFVLYLLAIQLQMILWNSGYRISPNLTFPVMFGALFIYLGFLLEHARQNWFIGIRTPWTLSSEEVWKRTHERGGKLFKLAGILCCFGVFAGGYALIFILVPVLAVTLYTVAYSYFEYQKIVVTTGMGS